MIQVHNTGENDCCKKEQLKCKIPVNNNKIKDNLKYILSGLICFLNVRYFFTFFLVQRFIGSNFVPTFCFSSASLWISCWDFHHASHLHSFLFAFIFPAAEVSKRRRSMKTAPSITGNEKWVKKKIKRCVFRVNKIFCFCFPWRSDGFSLLLFKESNSGRYIKVNKQEARCFNCSVYR